MSSKKQMSDTTIAYLILALSGGCMDAYSYLWPVLAFTIGIIMSDIMRAKVSNRHLHWRQATVAIEFLILTAVCVSPRQYNTLRHQFISL